MKGTLGCIIKLLVIFSILMLLFLAFLQLSGGSCIRRIDTTLPGQDVASWEVTTPMKLYYAAEVDIVKNDSGIIESVTMHTWYERINNRWIKHDEPITLKRRIYGAIQVKRRQ